MFEKLHPTTRRILSLARYEASKMGRATIDSEPLLLGLLHGEDEGICELLNHFQIRPDVLRQQIVGEVFRIGQIAAAASLELAQEGRKILALTREEAQAAGDSVERPEHLLLGILCLAECRAAKLLAPYGLDLDSMRSVLLERAARRSAPSPSRNWPLLSEFASDLTELAAQQAYDPLIGREQELALMIRVLSQRVKRNPLLVGEPGVGKTAIVEGLAQRIVAGQVPAFLHQRRVFALDLASTVAGTKYRGQFEERLRGILQELRNNPEIIFFVDEIHALVGAGSVEGSLDAANILKPAISRGEVSVVGATTVAEYRKHVQKDRSLARRFQAVRVEEPTAEKTLEILSGVRLRYEEFHRVRYQREALEAAVDLSTRYMTERHLPDKALELLDAAGATAKLRRVENENDQAWQEVVRGDVEEVISLATGVPAHRLRSDETELLSQMEEVLERRVVGQTQAISALSRAIRRSRLGIGSTRRPIGSFLFLGPSGVGKTEVARRLGEFLFGDDGGLIRFDMSEYMERHAVSKLIGSPPGYVGWDEGGQLTERVRERPYSLLLFDEIEKAHPEILNILLQVLEDGFLTDTYGHRVNFRNTLILMTSNLGSHHLAQKVRVGFGRENSLSVKTEVLAELKGAFPPEFVNRLDEVIVFNLLGHSELSSIVELLVGELAEDLRKDRGLHLEVTPAAREWLLNQAEIDPSSGARPLRRAIQTHVEDAISGFLLAQHGRLISGLEVDLEGEVLEVREGSPGDSRETARHIELRNSGEDLKQDCGQESVQ